MTIKILLTSFQTWLPNHKSNSSDDLLMEISQLTDAEFTVYTPHELTLLRKLPVDVELASSSAIAKINELQPDIVICCGMAESRTNLTVESQATRGDTVIKTPVDLEKLVTGLADTEISNDAGKFVCEGLYYSVLDYLREHKLNSSCIFLHVPILNSNNLSIVLGDFHLIIQKLASLKVPSGS